MSCQGEDGTCFAPSLTVSAKKLLGVVSVVSGGGLFLRTRLWFISMKFLTRSGPFCFFEKLFGIFD